MKGITHNQKKLLDAIALNASTEEKEKMLNICLEFSHTELKGGKIIFNNIGKEIEI